MTATRRVRINLLGPLEVLVGSRPVALRARKDGALIAALTLAPDRSLSRSRLAGLLWGDSAEPQARDSLKQALLRLRRAFAAAGAAPLVIERQKVALNAEVEVDAALLDNADAEAAEAALALRRGVPLDGLGVTAPAFQDWLVVERTRLETRYQELALRLLNRFEAAGRSEAAERVARRLLEADPLSEEAVRALMRTQSGRGQRRQALQLYQGLAERLSATLGIAPEPQTAALAQQLRRAGHAVPAPEVTGAAKPGATIAVLPFVTLGGNPAEDYFADGLTDDITTDLTQVEGITVAARSAAFTLKGQNLGATEAARQIGVAHVLEGSVRRGEGQVRVTARLVEGASGRQLWAGRFDRPLTDVFALQEELSRAVVEVLTGRLVGFPEGARRGTRDIEAYKLYLKARSFYLRGLDWHSLEATRMLLARAIEREQDYGQALALQAICAFYLSMRVAAPPGSPAVETLRELSARAFALDPEAADTLAAVGLAHYAEGDFEAANRRFGEAARRDPGLYEPPFFLARNSRLLGRRDEAAELYARAAELRREDYRATGLLAEELAALGRAEDERAALLETVARLERAVERHPDNADALAFGASVLAELGRLEEAREWCRWAMVFGAEEGLVQVNYNLARAFALTGDREAAIARLAKAMQTPPAVRQRIRLWLASDTVLAPLLDDRQGRALLEGATG